MLQATNQAVNSNRAVGNSKQLTYRPYPFVAMHSFSFT